MKKTLLLLVSVSFSLNILAQDKKIAEECFKKQIINVLKSNIPNWQKKSRSRNYNQNIIIISEQRKED
jgi:hypothetical protein